MNAEYLQEYLVDGVGDIGTHIEHTVFYMTGLKLKKVAAVLDNFGQPLDLNANILVEYENGVHGVFCSSHVCVGHMNGLVVRVFGTEGASEWVRKIRTFFPLH